MGLDREAALEKVGRENKNIGRVRYTITYDPKLPHLPHILHKNWKVMIESDPRLAKAFPSPPMACLRRGPNLKDKLVRARLPPKPGRPGSRSEAGPRLGFACCKAGRRGCGLCPYTGPASDRKTVVTQVNIHHSGQVLPVLEPITCKDSFCVYLLSCTKVGCLKQYVGCTCRRVYVRFKEHLDNIQDGNLACTTGRHWQEPGHSGTDVEFIPAEKLRTRNKATLREGEADLTASTGLLSAPLYVYRWGNLILLTAIGKNNVHCVSD